MINEDNSNEIKDIVLSYHGIPSINKIKAYFLSVKLFFRLLKDIKNHKQLVGSFAIVLLFRKFYLWKNYFSRSKFKNIIIDYDINFSKSISLALQSLSINTIAICERPFILSINPMGVIVNKYLLPGKLYEKYAKNNPSYIFDSSVNLGLYRKRYFYKSSNSGLNNLNFVNPYMSNKKVYQFSKIILFIGLIFNDDKPGLLFNKRSFKKFFSIISDFANKHPDKAIVLRMKSLKKKDLNIINKRFKKIPNFFLCDDYLNYGVSYSLCKNADLIISHPTTLVDEAIAFGKHVILLDDLFTIRPYSSYLYPNEFDFAIPKDDIGLHDLANKILSKDNQLINKYRKLTEQLSGDFDLSEKSVIANVIEENLVF